MLVVVANWGIADGTLLSAARHAQVEWLGAVRRAVIRAGMRRDGRYEPPERVDVVLAGDTFDLLTSTAWTAQARPWQRGPRARAARERVLAGAAPRAGRLLAGLRRWARAGMAVPRAGRNGRPAAGTEARVPVGVVLLAGDRDAWLEEAQLVASRHGIRIGVVWADSFRGASVRHGHEFDPFTSGDGESAAACPRDRGPTLAESLAVDLVARFGAMLAARPRDWPVTRPLVAALAGTRPAAVAAAFRRWRMRAAAAPVMVEDRWRTAVDAWWREARRTRPTCGVEYDPVDTIATALAAAGAATIAAPVAPFDPPCGLPDCCPAGDVAAAREILVLGHPPVTVTAGVNGAVSPSLVCLGRAGAPRSVPATAVFTRHDEHLRHDSLHDEPDAAIVASLGHASSPAMEAA
jgi:hypothetical protein